MDSLLCIESPTPRNRPGRLRFRRSVDGLRLRIQLQLSNPSHLPMMQVCDPRQPTAVVPIGRECQRISFMLDSESDFEQESQPERVWHRAARYLHPEKAELIRVATYTFRSLVARSWRVRRVMLAGDAAHQMPPFLGQGMCSGIRDAQNLAFKLDLVLRGRNPEATRYLPTGASGTRARGDRARNPARPCADGARPGHRRRTRSTPDRRTRCRPGTRQDPAARAHRGLSRGPLRAGARRAVVRVSPMTERGQSGSTSSQATASTCW